MGINQGIILRKVTLDRTLNQLNIFLKGSFVILLMYAINGIFVEKNFTDSNIRTLVSLYGIVLIGFLFLKFKKTKINEENEVMIGLKKYFDVKKFEDVENLDKQLIYELKKQRVFVSNKGQIVATESYILIDLKDGQFNLIPTKEISRVYLSHEKSRFILNIETDCGTEKFGMKYKSEVNEFINAYNDNF